MAGTVETTLSGRYVLGDVIGAGGSGVVRRAHDTTLDRPVAVKLLKAGEGDEVLRARLRAEATLAGQLHHAGIAQVYDYGEDDLEGSPTPYLVMEHVEGTSLWQLLKERRTLPVPEVMDLVAQVADALQAAHAAGIVHRDLKPSNVLVTADGRAVLVDFGIARTHDTEPLTNTGTIVGTADYVSPEQCEGRTATWRSDLYSLGMLAYECLTGHKPFHRESAVATALAHLRDEAPPLTGVPSGVADLVAQLIRKDPAERPGSAAEVSARAFALAGAKPDDPWTRILPAPPSPSRVQAERRPLWQRPAMRSRRLQVSAAAVAVTLGVGAFVAARPAPPVSLPDLEGMSWRAASALLAERDIDVERERVDQPGTPRGTVVTQSPEPGSSMAPSDEVTLQVASGAVVLDAGRVVGRSYEKAAQHLVGLGLVPVRQEVTRPGADGTVVTAMPAGRLDVGSLVTLSIGVPPEVDTAVTPSTTTATSSPAPTTAAGRQGQQASPSKPQGHASGEPTGKAKGKANGKAHGKAKGHRKH